MPSRIAVSALILALSQVAVAQAAAGDRENPAELQVVLDVRLITISDAVFERVGVEFEPVASAETRAKPVHVSTETPAGKQVQEATLGRLFLSADQVRRLMEDAQGDRHSNVLQAPRLTLPSGQSGTVDLTETQFFLTDVDVVRSGEHVICRPKNEPRKLGFRMTAKPTVSTDRRFVRVALNVNQTELAANTIPLMPVKLSLPRHNGSDKDDFTLFLQQPQFRTTVIDDTVVIPDGGTMVLAGFKKTIESRIEYGPPVLSRIPYVNRCFRNVGYGRDTQSLTLLVTPRIIGREEAKMPPKLLARTPQPVQVQNRAELRQAASWSVTAVPPARKAATSPCDAGRQVNILAELLKAYDEACAQGRGDEAERLARAALILNPGCFSSRKR